jgi:hypothetical protein
MVDDPPPGPETSRWLLGRAPRFARLWAAKAVSHLGDGAALVALVVYVQQTQGRGVAVSALLLAGTLPTLLGPLAGALVDRVEQRRLMVAAQAGQAVLYGPWLRCCHRSRCCWCWWPPPPCWRRCSRPRVEVSCRALSRPGIWCGPTPGWGWP